MAKKDKVAVFNLKITDKDIHWVTVDHDGTITGFKDRPVRCLYAKAWDIRVCNSVSNNGNIDYGEAYYVRLGNLDTSELKRFDWKKAIRFIG